jgi:hypothetical protein
MAFKHKKQAATLAGPLNDAGILKQVFTFLPGNWLFLGAVCREWQAIYASLGDQIVCRVSQSEFDSGMLVPCSSKTTLYSAVIASPSTARLAFDCGLAMNDWLEGTAGLRADAQTLPVLLELGMRLSEFFVKSVALSGRLNILQQLFTEQQCPQPNPNPNPNPAAAINGDINVFESIVEQGEVLNAELLTDALNCAGAFSRLLAAQWLRQHGALWPTELTYTITFADDDVEVLQWKNDMIVWARAEGCTSPLTL